MVQAAAGRQRAGRLLAVLLVLALAACGTEGSDGPPADADARVGSAGSGPHKASEVPADDEDDDEEPVLQIVATVEPLADLVAQVGGDRVAVRSLVPAGADAHTFQPRPGDVVGLADADMYVGVGLGLNDGALQLAEQHLPAGAPVVRLGDALDSDELLLDHVHDDGHSHGPEIHSHGSETHVHGPDTHTHAPEGAGPNPHVWTSLRLAGQLVAAIEAHLTDLDPAGALDYAANAAAYQAELESLDQAIGRAIATVPADQRTLVTYHDAWGYFARDHGLAFVTAIQPGDHSEPSAREVRDLIDLIREHGVPAVFGSQEFPTPVLEAISEETGAAYLADLSDDVLPGAPGDPEHSHLALMRRNAAIIVQGLGGDPAPLATGSTT